MMLGCMSVVRAYDFAEAFFQVTNRHLFSLKSSDLALFATSSPERITEAEKSACAKTVDVEATWTTYGIELEWSDAEREWFHRQQIELEMRLNQLEDTKEIEDVCIAYLESALRNVDKLHYSHSLKLMLLENVVSQVNNKSSFLLMLQEKFHFGKWIPSYHVEATLKIVRSLSLSFQRGERSQRNQGSFLQEMLSPAVFPWTAHLMVIFLHDTPISQTKNRLDPLDAVNFEGKEFSLPLPNHVFYQSNENSLFKAVVKTLQPCLRHPTPEPAKNFARVWRVMLVLSVAFCLASETPLSLNHCTHLDLAMIATGSEGWKTILQLPMERRNAKQRQLLYWRAHTQDLCV